MEGGVTRRTGMMLLCEAYEGDRLMAFKPGGVMVINPDHPPRIVTLDGDSVDIDPNAGIPTG